MSTITMGGNPVHTAGELPKVGSQAPDFRLTDTELNDFQLSDLKGSKVILNIFPSIGTGVCSASVRRFNQEASDMENTKVVCVSKDLPFAHKQFCGAEGITNVISASQYKDHSFSEAYNVDLLDGKFEGLMSRAIVVLDENGKVVYTEQVPEIGQEPNYEKAKAAVC
ncbi:MAG: thiol peroxidase [Bacteroidota bacterium]|nr:thiol peroxidase [Bacteroidota bacterium]MDX5427611.1 thiol peroxidase [Bacteroidota bacterium]MDX5448644.1 thiol peroxidase [Bacteroidota bacterium]MDX5505516.1 thiol peroxidase [Bacteroidota bacterium]